jgi:hypothetical protein
MEHPTMRGESWAENIDDTRFWGNLTPPDQPVQVVE